MPTETVLKSNDIETVAPARVGDTLGYARVSTHDQNPDAQSDRLIEAGAEPGDDEYGEAQRVWHYLRASGVLLNDGERNLGCAHRLARNCRGDRQPYHC